MNCCLEFQDRAARLKQIGSEVSVGMQMSASLLIAKPLCAVIKDDTWGGGLQRRQINGGAECE